MPEPPHHDLCIVLTYYSPYVSGLTNVARDLAEGLAARGWRVCVVASKHDPSLPTEEVVNRVQVVRAPVLAKVGKGTIGINLTRLALREMARSALVNLHLPLVEAGLLARLSPVPVVSTYHCDVSLPTGDGPVVRRVVNHAQHRAIDFSSSVALRRSTAAVVSSEDYARHSRLWPAIDGRLVAVPPPCPPRGPGRPTFRRGDGFHVGFLGRIVEEKGVEHLVDAFLALDDPDARLLVGGDYEAVAGGSVVDRVRRHIRDDPRIEMLGFVPEGELDDFYASLDVFALPSVNAFEAFGIVQVVAMMAGVPAVVSDLPGVRTVVEETGFGAVVAPRDVDGLAAALSRLRDSPPDTEAGSTAAATRYSVESVLDAYEAVFHKAAGR
ncbi:glycosyltransferase family 4 protein [Actinomycetospora straminea]|uniref:Glycosyltransferase family 4 protein n=1 Tax=Actinomycetospora straminea TaxID=663607 RepID=A0ABP9E498_9PSEU|nr:glycosyltransferase family 4 protein [Actinomycetospora straminea]MDD7934645.1 glycosyltransferase family 4 protein [Actinomycetospora straminea]